MNAETFFSSFGNFVIAFSLILILIVLFYESINDVKYRRISKGGVVVLYILTPIYVFASGIDLMTASFTFLFTLGVFLVIWLVSFGRFGIGDSLVLGAVGWFLGDFTTLQNFLFILAIFAIPWSAYWMYYYMSKGYKDLLFKFTNKIKIDKVISGMVLANDKFMHGLDENDIEKLKANGKTEVTVKQPLPFIPIIFFALVVSLI
jgi:prepilin signal peptidase PulO-like enzyme (type II secretory pathway)